MPRSPHHATDDEIVAAALLTPLGPPGGPDPLRVADWRRLGLTPSGAAAAARSAHGPAASRLRDLLERAPGVAEELAGLTRRGMRLLTVAHPLYPQMLLARLGDAAPAALYVAGDAALLSTESVAVVGSRDVSPEGASLATSIGEQAAREGLTLVTGAARGVDRIALEAATRAGGRAAAILAGAMDRSLTQPETRSLLNAGRLALACPYPPGMPFTGPNALGRNRIIYALAGCAIVVASAQHGGGTRHGAMQALRKRWATIYAIQGEGTGTGNEDLLAHGAIALPAADVRAGASIRALADPARALDPAPLLDD